MEELLFMLLQFLGELLFDVLLSLPVSAFEAMRRRVGPLGVFWRCVGWAAVGGGVGAVTLWVAPHTLIASPALRVANLVAAPLLSGELAHWRARRRARREGGVEPGHHFWQAALFTFAIALVRYRFGLHP